jgi:hypothetical protein
MRLAAGGALRRHAHGLIGECRQHAAMHNADMIAMLLGGDKAEHRIAAAPDRTDMAAKIVGVDHVPAGDGRIESLSC